MQYCVLMVANVETQIISGLAIVYTVFTKLRKTTTKQYTKIQLNRYHFLARLLTLNQQSRKCPCAVCIDNLSVLFCEPAASQ